MTSPKPPSATLGLSPNQVAAVSLRVSSMRRDAGESDWPCVSDIVAASDLGSAFGPDGDLFIVLVDLPPAAHAFAEQWARAAPCADHYEGAWGQPAVCLRFATPCGRHLFVDIDALEDPLLEASANPVRLLICIAAGEHPSHVLLDAAVLREGQLATSLYEAYLHAGEQRSNLLHHIKRGWAELEYIAASERYALLPLRSTMFIATPRLRQG